MQEQFLQLENDMPKIQEYYGCSFKKLAAGLFKHCQEGLEAVAGPGFGDLTFENTCQPSHFDPIYPGSFTDSFFPTLSTISSGQLCQQFNVHLWQLQQPPPCRQRWRYLDLWYICRVEPRGKHTWANDEGI